MAATMRVGQGAVETLAAGAQRSLSYGAKSQYLTGNTIYDRGLFRAGLVTVGELIGCD